MILHLIASCFLFPALVQSTKRPIIGILSQESYDRTNESLIFSSYVKMVEASGARVVPIFISKPNDYYQKIVQQVNGVVFPGGSADIYGKNGYADAGRIIYDIAVKMNEKGDHFPILGVCLGLELLTAISSGNQSVLTKCSGLSNVNLPLDFVMNPFQSRLFARAPVHYVEILGTLPVTANHHRQCVTRKTLEKLNLNDIWKVISVNTNSNGTEFISSMEHRRFPFASIQFHPEKVAFEWAVKGKNPHFPDAVQANRLFYDWLVREALKSHHGFVSEQDELNSLIYNYNPEFTGKANKSAEQTYFFPRG